MASQKEVADHLFLKSDRQIRNLSKMPGAPVSRGRGGYDLDEWRQFYINYLKNGGIDESRHDPYEDDAELKKLKLDKERATLDDKLESIEMKKLNRRIKEGQYAPIEVLTAALSSVMSAVNSRMEGMLPRLKQAWPDMPVEAHQALEKEKIALSNELSESEPDLAAYFEIDTEGDEGGAEGT